jgi:chaperonin cofactor prefoldin
MIENDSNIEEVIGRVVLRNIELSSLVPSLEAKNAALEVKKVSLETENASLEAENAELRKSLYQ